MANTKDIFDNSIFRYRSVSDASLSAFEKDRLYFSTPENFNDPYDNLMYIDTLGIIENIIYSWHTNMDQYLDSQVQKNFMVGSYAKALSQTKKWDEHQIQFLCYVADVIEDIKKRLQKNVKIICFAEDCLSMLMWSHYADNHKGFLLVYDKDEICAAQRFGKRNDLLDRKTCLRKVEYRSERVDMTEEIEGYLLKHELPKTEKRDQIPEISQRKLRDFMLRKSEDWAYEKEWRLMPRTINLQEESPLHYIEIKPKGIILGARCEDRRDELIRLAKRKKISVYGAVVSDTNSKYGIELKVE